MFVVAGAGAVGYAAAAKLDTSAAPANPAGVAEANRSGAQPAKLDTSAAPANPAGVAEANRSGAQRAHARTQQHKLASRARARRALDLARKVAADRVAREQAREGILDRARSNPRAVARLLLADKGWGGEQFGCLDRLWAKESGWSWQAGSSSSGPYGIPQSLPGSKMASVGGDWATNPVTQIRWGLKYISNRYGTPCSAWAQFQAVNWY